MTRIVNVVNDQFIMCRNGFNMSIFGGNALRSLTFFYILGPPWIDKAEFGVSMFRGVGMTKSEMSGSFPTSWTMELTKDSIKFHLKIPVEFLFTENQSMESFDFVLEGTWR